MPQNGELSELEGQVYNALCANHGPVLPETLAATLAIREVVVRRALGRLVQLRRARRAGGGKYTPAARRRSGEGHG